MDGSSPRRCSVYAVGGGGHFWLSKRYGGPTRNYLAEARDTRHTAMGGEEILSTKNAPIFHKDFF